MLINVNAKKDTFLIKRFLGLPWATSGSYKFLLIQYTPISNALAQWYILLDLAIFYLMWLHKILKNAPIQRILKGGAIIQEGPLLVQVQNLVSGLGHLLGVLGAFRFYNLVLGVSWASGAQSDLKIWSWAPFGHLLGVLGAFRFDNLVLGTFWASWAQSDLTTCSWTPLGRLWCIQIWQFGLGHLLGVSGAFRLIVWSWAPLGCLGPIQIWQYGLRHLLGILSTSWVH